MDTPYQRSLIYPFARAWYGLPKAFRVAVVFFTVAAFIGFYMILKQFGDRYTYRQPVYGGAITEGLIGIPRYINPLLATTEPDMDATRLVYAGLMQKTAFDTYAPYLASSCITDDTQKVYTCTLNAKARFQDGKKVTAQDVAFTIDRIQKEYGTQALALAWRGVTVATQDNKTIVFTLEQPYAGFSDMLTVGILPEHVWGNLDKDAFAASEYNLHPIGAGPFKITHITYERKNGARFPSEFTLTAFRRAIHKPHLAHISLVSFASAEELISALERGRIDATAYLTKADADIFASKTRFTSLTSPLTKPFALFINDGKSPALQSPELRKALQKIVSNIQVASGISQFGVPVSNFTEIGLATQNTHAAFYADDEIKNHIEKAGYVLDETTGMFVSKKDKTPLSLTILTTQSKELQDLVAYLKEHIAAYGIGVEGQFIDAATLEQNYVRSRSFTILLFGLTINTSADWFAYLHSTQIDYPGLNITRFADTNVDKAVRGLLNTYDTTVQTAALETLDAKAALALFPIVFLYEPMTYHIANKKFTLAPLATTQSIADHFNNADQWYRYSVRTFTFFKKH